jgi:hypothetical protein
VLVGWAGVHVRSEKIQFMASAVLLSAPPNRRAPSSGLQLGALTASQQREQTGWPLVEHSTLPPCWDQGEIGLTKRPGRSAAGKKYREHLREIRVCSK